MTYRELMDWIKDEKMEDFGAAPKSRNGYRLANTLHVRQKFPVNVVYATLKTLKLFAAKQKRKNIYIKDIYPYAVTVAKHKKENGVDSEVNLEKHWKKIEAEKDFIKKGGLSRLGINIS